MLGFGPYKNVFKFFGGGEVLSEERDFPHDGRNLLLLFWSTIVRKNFVLLGGIGEPKKSSTKLLYRYLLPRAASVVTREKTSFATAKNWTEQVIAYHDFSESVFATAHYKKIPTQTILVNLNQKSHTLAHIHQIKSFVQKFPGADVIYFPCEMTDDALLYTQIKLEIPQIRYYDWTNHSLKETLKLFASCTAGIGARLHFLIPLKLYHKDFIPIVYAHKVEKMLAD
ncbi:MAG: polysaccharide pyruvyl transferase family protein [Candidatus Absconditabacteria bacterium]